MSKKNIVRFSRCLHSSKEDNDDLVEFFDDKELKYCGYEEEIFYEYNRKTKKLKVIGINGFFTGDEKITPGELTEIPEP